MRTPPLPVLRRLVVGFGVAVCAGVALAAQIPSRNVNMVAGREWPGGDPFLQRQNEPSIAASTRNPLHLVGGSNDYRTVDLPGLPDAVETGDAWLSVYKSFDGGQRWASTLIPGYPQDTSAAGLASPLRGHQAAADPVVRAGTSGLIYYNGLAFDRTDGGKSTIFLTRFIDLNNQENGDPIAYGGTSIVATTSGAAFLDKPWLAVDIPRGSNPPQCLIGDPTSGVKVKPNGHRNRGAGNGKGNAVPDGYSVVKAGAIYVAYTSITGQDATLRSEILLKRSTDCGATWSAPMRVSNTADAVNQGATVAISPLNGNVYVAWRRFATATVPGADAVMVARLPFGAAKTDPPGRARGLRRAAGTVQDNDEIFEHRRRGVHNTTTTPPTQVADLDELDQGTNGFRFRTNAYPSMTIDGTGRVYVAWAERGYAQLRPDPASGDARVLIATSANGIDYSAPAVVDDAPNRPGHQLMPTLAFAGGKLMLVFYDLRETKAGIFGQFVSDADTSTGLRQTIDIRAALGTPGAAPAFAPSVRVSDYLTGYRDAASRLEQLQVNPPNLPMFKAGTVPFIGDYIDVAPSPAFVPTTNGNWAFNTAATADLPVFQAAWTDNRDVRPPLDGNWQNYTPPTIPGASTTSLFDPSKTVAVCQAGNAGSRNQNVYTARIGGGLLVGAPGNTKPLSTTLPRGFVVFAQNQTRLTKTFRMKALAQPAGGRASFSQFPRPPYTASSPAPVTFVDVRVPPLSTATRTLYVTSSDATAQVTVAVTEITAVGGTDVANGLAGRVLLNPDIENPDIENPDIENPDIENPDIENAEVYNPDIENPDIENPSIRNPDIENPDIENPDIENVVVANPDIANLGVANPDIANPDIENPDIENPDIENPDIENGAIADVTWTISNTGNTTAAFNVNLFLAQATIPGGVKTQLVLYKTYKTPVLAPNGCDLRVETRNVLLLNLPNPTFITPGRTLPGQNDPSTSNATLWLSPGEIGRITLRVYDNDPSNNVLVTNLDGSTALIDPVLNPANGLTAGISAQGVATNALAGTVRPPVVTTTGTNLVYLQQPTNAVPGGIITPPVKVRVWTNAGAPLSGVTVTMALVNGAPGAVLSGATAVSDADGIATFPLLSVNVASAGVQLKATASVPGIAVAGTSVPFSVGTFGTWAASGTGVVTTLNNGASGLPAMQYQSNSFFGTWQMSTVAAQAGTHPLSYYWNGFHSFFQATALLDVFVSRGGVDVFVANLVNAGPNNCAPCLPPSAGFTYTGTTSVTVLPGDTFGFRLSGTHSDSANLLQGLFKVSVDHAPAIAATSPVTIAPGQMVVLRGEMPAAAATGVLFNQGGPDLPASYAFTATPNLAVVRSPAGLVPGQATVRSVNGPTTTAPFPITIAATPGAPRLFALSTSCGGPTVTSITAGTPYFVLADGVDTSGTTFVWERSESPTLTTPTVNTTGSNGNVCTQTIAPAGLTSGGWTLSITTTVGGVQSAASNGIGIIVP